MQFSEIPFSYHTKAISICFNLLNKKDEFVAVKVFCMTQAGKFCKLYPELTGELMASIEAQYAIETGAFRARARIVLKSLGLPAAKNYL
jgi:hypothetical protein